MSQAGNRSFANGLLTSGGEQCRDRLGRIVVGEIHDATAA